jgi:uroporphyrinogen III methyltransferase/synthase
MTSVLVTRPMGFADPLVKALEHLGYRVHAVPAVETEPLELKASELASFDWIVLTSVQGVDALAELPLAPRYAAVGEKTAHALEARGIKPGHVPAQANGLALADTLPDVEGRRIVLVRASAAASDLPDRLRRRGAIVEEMTVYRTVEGPATSVEPMRAALVDPELAAVVFASGSAVRGYLTLGGPATLPAVTIGPRTTSSAREHGFHVIAEADSQSAESLAAAVSRTVPLEAERNA